MRVHTGSSGCFIAVLDPKHDSYFISRLAQLREPGQKRFVSFLSGRILIVHDSPLFNVCINHHDNFLYQVNKCCTVRSGALNKPATSQARLLEPENWKGQGGESKRVPFTDKHHGHQQSDPTIWNVWLSLIPTCWWRPKGAWEHTSSGQPLSEPRLTPSLFPL